METSASRGVREYNTQILGAVKSVLESKSAIAYNKYNLPQDKRKISIYNMEDILLDIYDEGDNYYTKLTRTSTSEPYEYEYHKPEYGIESGFNVLVYLDTSGKAIGYTDFSNTQGKTRSLSIYLDFDSSVKKSEITIHISNSLSNVRGKTITPDSLEVLSGWTGSNDAKSYVSSLPERNYYSEYIDSLILGDKISSVNVSGISLMTSSSIYYRFGVGINLNINPYFYQGFNKYSVGLYNGFLVLYSYDTTENRYSVYGISQSSLNIFSNPQSYTNITDVGYTELSSLPGENYKFKYGAGKYLIFENDEGNIKIYNFEKQLWVIDSEFTFIDPFDISGKLRKCEENLEFVDLIEQFPELSRCSYTLDNNYSYQVIRIIGSWVILKRSKYSISTGIVSDYILTSPSLTLIALKEELPGIILVNDSTALVKFLRYPEDESGNYYSMYTPEDDNQYIFETDWHLSGKDGEMTLINEIGVFLDTSSPLYEDRVNLYQTKKIKKVDMSLPVFETPLSMYRRGFIPRLSSTNILTYTPELLGAYQGVLFYLQPDGNNNILNYL